MSDYLNQLNNIQRQAVTHVDGPLMVIAGPGSGKTRVLTFRIAYLIEQGISPDNILALTFTNKAAAEMRERIRKVTGDAANQLWAGTFHSIFARILRREAPKLGFPSSFTIFDTADGKSLIKDIIKSLSLDSTVYKSGEILSRISSAKSNLITPKRYAQNEDLQAQDRMRRRPMLYKIYEEYTKRLHSYGAMDFDDLLLNLFRLLYENKENVRDKYRNQFKYILVDEFQDTNFLQYSILKLLMKYDSSPENICIVGDDAQSIYAFRGATIDNILDFQKDFPGTKIYKLEQNYRSTNHIVQAANEVISKNKRQIKKEIWTDQGQGNKIRLIQASRDVEEGSRVAGAIVEYKNRFHYSNNDIAILYRTNAQSRIFEEHLRKRNIPYHVIGGLSFYQRKEVKDLIAYLRLVVNPADDEAFKRIINTPRRGIGDKSLEKIIEQASANGSSLLASLPNVELGGKADREVKNLYNLIVNTAEASKVKNAYDVLLHVYKASGLERMLQEDKDETGRDRLENINALLDGAREFVENDEVDGDPDFDRSLTSYLQNIALLTDIDSIDEEDERVTLMSVHAAKGLEFKALFMVGLEENLFPSFQSMDDPSSLDEERRLFYVGITRAEEVLTLSFARSRYHHGNMQFNDPSRFISEISGEHFENASNLHEPEAGYSFQKRMQPAQTKTTTFSQMPAIDLSNFKPSPSNEIAEGQKVLHMKFGKGEVVKVEGSRDKRIATIRFDDVLPAEKRIMLKFAKLEIL